MVLQGVPLKLTPLNFLSVRPNSKTRGKKLRVSDFVKGWGLRKFMGGSTLAEHPVEGF